MLRCKVCLSSSHRVQKSKGREVLGPASPPVRSEPLIRVRDPLDPSQCRGLGIDYTQVPRMAGNTGSYMLWATPFTRICVTMFSSCEMLGESSFEGLNEAVCQFPW